MLDNDACGGKSTLIRNLVDVILGTADGLTLTERGKKVKFEGKKDRFDAPLSKIFAGNSLEFRGGHIAEYVFSPLLPPSPFH